MQNGFGNCKMVLDSIFYIIYQKQYDIKKKDFWKILNWDLK